MSDEVNPEVKKRPRRAGTRQADNIVECPNCKKHIPVIIEYVPQLERDEFGMLVLDEQGNPKTRMKTIPVTSPTVAISPNYDPEREEEYMIAAQRAAEERYKMKKPKPTIIAEAAA
jgi:hypothetical protein